MEDATAELARVHDRWAPVDARVKEILEHIRRDCLELDPHARNQSNERQVEQFIAWLAGQFPDRCYAVERGPRGGVEGRRRAEQPHHHYRVPGCASAAPTGARWRGSGR